MSSDTVPIVPIVLCVIVFSVFMWYEVKAHIAEFSEPANKDAGELIESSSQRPAHSP